MLVLSRRPQEKIVFPEVDITVQVVSIKSGSVRLGIEAPQAVTVLRAELPHRGLEWDQPTAVPQRDRFALRRLQVDRLGLAEMRAHLEVGRIEAALQLLDKIEEDVELLQRRLESQFPLPLLAERNCEPVGSM